MGKTHHHSDRSADGGGRHDPTTTNAQTRSTLISKSLSRLLRHAAVQERIPMDEHGWVRVDQILSWRGLAKFVPKVELGEVLQCVREDGKGRFGLWYTGKVAEGTGVEGTEGLSATGTNVEAQTEAGTETQTSIALRTFDAAQNLEPTHYKIRANQGHSIKGVSEEGLLTPITLPTQDSGNSTESTVPKTVVHGTFYAAYEAILAEGLLKPMSRNHVHFSTGPDVEVARGCAANNDGRTDNTTTGVGQGRGKGPKLAQMMSAAKVRSGMRPDAEVLIYVDIERALRDGMKWWRSENGVLLSEGLAVSPGVAAGKDAPNADDAEQTEAKAKGKERQTQRNALSGISKEYWLEVVEVKEGLGTLWRDGRVVQHLPERLKGRALPMGKGRRGGDGGRGGGRGGRSNSGGGGDRGGREGKPRLNVERDGGRDEGRENP